MSREAGILRFCTSHVSPRPRLSLHRFSHKSAQTTAIIANVASLEQNVGVETRNDVAVDFPDATPRILRNRNHADKILKRRHSMSWGAHKIACFHLCHRNINPDGSSDLLVLNIC